MLNANKLHEMNPEIEFAYVQAEGSANDFYATKHGGGFIILEDENIPKPDKKHTHYAKLPFSQEVIEQRLSALKAKHHFVKKEKPKQTIEEPIDQQAQNIPVKVDYTPGLHQAIFENNLSLLQEYLKNRANVNIQDKFGQTALHVAVFKSNFAAVNILLGFNPDVNLLTDHKATPLLIAAKQGHIDIVETLIAKGADGNLASATGKTALMIAAEEGHDAIVELLAKSGADVNVKNKQGFTPLFIAAQNGKLELVKTLIAHGADVNLAIPINFLKKHHKEQNMQDLIKLTHKSSVGGKLEITPREIAIVMGHHKIAETLSSSDDLYLTKSLCLLSIVKGYCVEINNNQQIFNKTLSKAAEQFANNIESLISDRKNVHQNISKQDYLNLLQHFYRDFENQSKLNTGILMFGNLHSNVKTSDVSTIKFYTTILTLINSEMKPEISDKFNSSKIKGPSF